jgi:hypothetical protein
VGAICCNRPDRPWRSLSLLHGGCYVSFLAVKRSECGTDHPTPSRTEVKERVHLNFYSPSGPSWPVLGLTLTFLTLSTNSAPKPAIKYLEPTGQSAEVLLKCHVALELLGYSGPEVRNFLQLCLEGNGVLENFLILLTVCPVSACILHQ